MIRVPDWAFEAAGQETRGMDHDAAAYHPRLYLTPSQVVFIDVSVTPSTPHIYVLIIKGIRNQN